MRQNYGFLFEYAKKHSFLCIKFAFMLDLPVEALYVVWQSVSVTDVLLI